MDKIDRLQAEYIDALDRKRMGDWLNTFSSAGSYICQTLESVQAGWDIALILDDCRGRLEDRVKFVEKIWAGTFQDYQTRHFAQRITCGERESGIFDVRSNFSVAFTRCDTGQTGVLATGVYEDVVDLNGSTAQFISKRAVIDAPFLPHYIVYPL
ncbi:hypothetical protein N5K27_01885 [Pigmentiphaga sp. GD03639]|uniref:aromatic-ring-hydroxylating dioxygenase subunit beta n=1 Tax=Pigmentiphaga sp. GD03639 TaxID=2975354 RepID=UPI00244A394D|nr:aromatic-ring-hydroxylating dioxygenase subunit beta [Pigmentiphaga sp. GD03639]MDH2235039.1 hypothetical protein [Pigmentiphaga sp. GD03639]